MGLEVLAGPLGLEMVPAGFWALVAAEAGLQDQRINPMGAVRYSAAAVEAVGWMLPAAVVMPEAALVAIP